MKQIEGELSVLQAFIGQVRACLVHKKWTQKVLQYLSHQILRHMHGVLNVDERKN
jgi:hypothetical protein